MEPLRRALISCYDKTDLDRFAQGLLELGVELVASGGTSRFLEQHKISAMAVETFTGATEQLDGRVKTLHPRIHAGILARREDPAHVRAVGTAGLIDLVVVNLYPFAETIRTSGIQLAEALEQIDIGGVALLRAAAKNFPSVVVVSHRRQYARVLDALRAHRGTIQAVLAQELAIEAFRLTGAYDRAIAEYLAEHLTTQSTSVTDAAAHQLTLAPQWSIQAHQRQVLRYGENPHQRSGWYVPQQSPAAGLGGIVQAQGKELTYNNLLDVDAAVRCALDFDRPTCVIIKHASPCGIASSETIAEAYRRAYEADSESAFGGIVAFNRPLDVETASRMVATFLEVVIAPRVETEAKVVFAKKPNVRVLECPALEGLVGQPPASNRLESRSILGGWLVQAPDATLVDPSSLRVVTKCSPSEDERRNLLFAWAVAKHVKSNAIVLAKHEATVGIGQGQPSRVRAVRLAIQNAGPRGRGAVLASDGFFPFPDSVALAAEAGVSALIQPGGSVKDQEVIAAADHAGLAMMLTGIRHFRH